MLHLILPKPLHRAGLRLAHAVRKLWWATLRPRVDPVFLPRRTVTVPALPREPSTGKLPAIAFDAWARNTLGAGR